ncbi:glycosyltransferase family 2 protein [Thiotrichales bacterium HSG1]|nr:glycosyltransferase family 2 protein [Thiotrichales bacterium HSG1]
MKQPNLSVIIITRNEEHCIVDCLNSVVWCDEIIVVDSGSTDDTVMICRQFTDKIFINTNWQGFGYQKNLALTKATGKWVLSIDADEQVPKQLRQEIEQVVNHSELSAFQIPRLSSYCGRLIRHSGWFPDYVIRLFQRDQASFSNDLVHERVLVSDNRVGTLKTPFLHNSFTSLEEVLTKVNDYSSANAQMHYEKGKTATLKKAILHGVWAFIRTYLLRYGFLDGREGFILAISNAEGTYYRYLKLMYLQENGKNKPNNNNL